MVETGRYFNTPGLRQRPCDDLSLIDHRGTYRDDARRAWLDAGIFFRIKASFETVTR